MIVVFFYVIRFLFKCFKIGPCLLTLNITGILLPVTCKLEDMMDSVEDSDIKVSSHSNIKSQIRPNNGGWKSGKNDENPWMRIFLQDDFSSGGKVSLLQRNNIKSIRVFTGTTNEGFQNEISVWIFLFPYYFFQVNFKM